MKKRNAALFAAAMALLAGGAQAQSSVQAMGTVDAFAGRLKLGGDTAGRSVLNSGGMTTSWWGFKGTEDLGGGLKAGFALTSFLQVDSGTPGRFTGDSFFSRDANVSLSGGFGTLTAGRGLAPNFLPTILFNPFGDSFTFSPLVLHNNVGLFNGTGWTQTTPSDTGWSNEIIYSTPSFGGFTANLHYQFGEQPNESGVSNVGLNVLYFNGPFAATAFYEHDEVSNPVPARFTGNDTKTDWMVGASWDFTVAKLSGTFGKADSDVVEQSTKTWSVGATAPVGTGSLMLAYAHSKVDVTGTTRKTASLGYDYPLSKSTDLYSVVMRDSVTSFESGTSFGAGIRKRF
jgi:predicted porin